MENRQSLQPLLEQVLGNSYTLRNGELAFFCKFCNHHKRKFQINLQNQHWHCWVCNAGGRSLRPLLYKLNVAKDTIKQILSLVQDTKFYKPKENDTQLSLPKSFTTMWSIDTSVLMKHAHQVCKSRNIHAEDMVRYNIGYADEGVYANRLIIPSYDENGILNYFVARDMFKNSTMKYKNPPVSKNIIMFENLVTFTKPIVLVEGVMDAIAVRRNAIPMLGKFPSKKLLTKLYKYKPQVTIALDADAQKDAIVLSQNLINNGMDVKNITFNNEEDPSSIGFDKFWKKTNKPKLKFSDMLRGRLYGN